MSHNVKNFKKQQALLRSKKPERTLNQKSSRTTDSTYLYNSTSPFVEFENRHDDIEESMRQGTDVTFEDANAILSDIRLNWEQEKIETLLTKCRNQIINSMLDLLD
jgi:hypothetical protein